MAAYEDCVAAMRFYKRMKYKRHKIEDFPQVTDPHRNNFASWRQYELERMSPDDLLMLSRSDYYC